MRDVDTCNKQLKERIMYKTIIKRVLDIMGSIMLFPVFLLALLLFGPIIKLTDGGPVFYNPKRIGRNGRLFTMLKFRSMYVDSPDIRLSDGSTYNGDDDPRVTKIGRFIRKTSIDELPQIINVLIGNMSFIGPRPDPPDWIEKYPEEIKVFLTVRPGITGYSQAYYRNSDDGNQKMEHDAYYARHLTFLFDCKILLKTITTVFRSENTYKDLSGEAEAIKQAEELKK